MALETHSYFKLQCVEMRTCFEFVGKKMQVKNDIHLKSFESIHAETPYDITSIGPYSQKRNKYILGISLDLQSQT